MAFNELRPGKILLLGCEQPRTIAFAQPSDKFAPTLFRSQNNGRTTMAWDAFSTKIDRRTLVKAAALAGVAQIASPFIITARAADEVKIGLDNPLTGTYAAVGKNELIGCQLALEQINAKGGIMGRKAELLVEDSTSGDAATAVQKARKLIDRDKVNFLLGNVNSALAMAMS
ncbi:MAG: ABC transporter substrate-binding protein, partial [Pseudolabrys sp.]